MKRKLKVDETYYVKRGRRYEPVGVGIDYGIPVGAYLLRVGDHCMSVTAEDITPDTAAMQAAMEDARDAIVPIVRRALSARPTCSQLTRIQADAWNAMVAAGVPSLHMPSAYDIAGEIVSAVRALPNGKGAGRGVLGKARKEK